MKLRDFAIVAVEEGNKVLSQIALVFTVERTHNAKIDGDIFGVFRVFGRNKDIARVHVCMEKTVAKYLSEEYFHTALGQFFHIGILGK